MPSGLRKESRYHAHMKNDWLKRLEKLKDEAVQHGAIASKLSELRSEARRIFDERIEELTRVRDKERIKEIERVSIQKRPDGTVLVKVPVDWRYVLAAPFIYGMIFPSVIWHLALESYHQVSFRLYGIPLVDPDEYFIYDRYLLERLNWTARVNCYYCSYVNNLLAYSTEIAARTERYWCPLKYERHIHRPHSQYEKFIAADSVDTVCEGWEKLQDFSDMTQGQHREQTHHHHS